MASEPKKKPKVTLRRITRDQENNEEGKPLDWVKLLVRPGDGNNHQHSIAGWKLTGDIGAYVVQMPIEDSDLVAHVEIFKDGTVSTSWRKKLYDGKWSEREYTSIPELATLERLGN